MKSILCFGDSNTWGFIPAGDSQRFPPHIRWTGILQAQLGTGYRVIEEAQNGRTTVLDDPHEPVCKNGSRALPVALESHAPLDLIVIMLGTNDLKHYFHREPVDVAEGIARLADIALLSASGPSKSAPQVLLVAPPKIHSAPCPFGAKLDGSAEKSPLLAPAYRAVCESRGIPFFDASALILCPPTDCIHMDEQNHLTLGTALAERVAARLA